MLNCNGFNIDYEKYEAIIKAFVDYPMNFCNMGVAQRILFFPDYGCYALTVFASDKEDINVESILRRELEIFSEYKYDESKLVIMLEDAEDIALDEFGDAFKSSPKDIFGQLFYNLYSTLKIVCVNQVDGMREEDFNFSMEKMRQDIWSKVFDGEFLPDELGYKN